MAAVDAFSMLLKAGAGGYAVGAFNVTSLRQLLGVVDAAVERRAPLILQTSVTPTKTIGCRTFSAVFRSLAEAAQIPMCLHLDHCTDPDYCVTCAEAGYTNVMIDASQLPLTENIRIVKTVCDAVHRLGGISVEAELGIVSGVEDQVAVVEDEARLCNPKQAVEFVLCTGVDLFAPAIGTAHGVYRTPDPRVDVERLAAIRRELDSHGLRTPLVIHGGTGLPENTVRRLISSGGAKFNVSTELKHVLVDVTRQYLQDRPAEYDPGGMDAAVRDATKRAVASWIDLLGCAGKA